MKKMTLLVSLLIASSLHSQEPTPTPKTIPIPKTLDQIVPSKLKVAPGQLVTIVANTKEDIYFFVIAQPSIDWRQNDKVLSFVAPLNSGDFKIECVVKDGFKRETILITVTNDSVDPLAPPLSDSTAKVRKDLTEAINKLDQKYDQRFKTLESSLTFQFEAINASLKIINQKLDVIPKPPVPPPPIPVVIKGPIRIFIVEEASQRTLETRTIIFSSSFRNYLDKIAPPGADGKPNWYIVDKDLDVKRAGQLWSLLMASAQSKPLPYIYVLDDTTILYEGVLPKTVEDTISIINKAITPKIATNSLSTPVLTVIPTTMTTDAFKAMSMSERIQWWERTYPTLP